MLSRQPEASLLSIVRQTGEVPVSALDTALEDGRFLEENLVELLDGIGSAPLVDDRFAARILADREVVHSPTRLDRFVERARILSAEAESRLAKRIEFTRRRFERTVLTSPLQDAVKRQHLSALYGPHDPRMEQPAPPTKRIPTMREIDERWDEYLAQRNELIESNIALLEHLAARYRTYGIPHVDLVQHGSLGLIRAVDKFDWRRNVRFRTYAELWIRQAIERATDTDRDLIHVPRPIRQKISKANHIHRKSGRLEKLDAQRFAELTGVDPTAAAHALNVKSGIASLDASLFDDGGSLKESFADDVDADGVTSVEREHLRSRVNGLLSQLPEREAKVLNLRYGLAGEQPHTLEEVGELMHISRERVRQLQNRAIDQLRDRGRSVDQLLEL